MDDNEIREANAVGCIVRAIVLGLIGFGFITGALIASVGALVF